MTKRQLSVSGFGADVPILPPILCFALLVVAFTFHYVKPRKLLPKIMTGTKSVMLRMSIFAGVVASGYYFMTAGVEALDEAGSGVNFTEVNGLVTDTFPYNHTRNPLYVVIVYFVFPSFSILFDSKWFLFLMPIMFFYIDLVVIPSEEKLLSGLYPDDYAEYRENVPRWFTLTSR